MSTTEALTPEQKKAKAQAAKEAAAAKRKADAQAKADQKATADAESQAALLTEATATVTTLFNALNTSVTQGNGFVEAAKASVASIVAESTAEQIEAANAATVQNTESANAALVSAKASLKDIKATVKKLKEPGDLAVAVTTAESLVTGLVDSVKGLRTAASDVKKATKAAEKAKAQAAKEAEKAANAMPKQNDITRPRPGTACGDAWALMDELSEKLKSTVPISILLQAAAKKGLNHDTAKTQYARWKKFNGIEGRVSVPLPEGLLD